MITSERIEQFWKWFNYAAASLASDSQRSPLLQELDAKVRELDPMLSWEIGPGGVEPWQLVLSPNLDPDLYATAREIISHAPVIRDWEFHAARRPKEWDYKLLMERSDGRPLELDVSGWKFVLLQYSDGGKEILLQGHNLPTMDNDERWQAAAITLESILGEEVLLEKMIEFEVVSQIEPRFDDKVKPIQQLRGAVLAT